MKKDKDINAERYKKLIQINQQVIKIAEELNSNNKIDTAIQAKKHKIDCVQSQKQLKLIRKEVLSMKKIISTEFNNEKLEVNSQGISFLFGKGKARSANAKQKILLQNKKLNIIKPYEDILNVIDNLLVQIDKRKIDIDNAIRENDFNQ